MTWRPIDRARSIASRWSSGSGNARLRPGEVHGDEPVGDAVLLEAADEREVALRRVRAHERGDEPDLDARSARAAADDPFQTASTTWRPVSPWFVWRSGAQRTSA